MRKLLLTTALIGLLAGPAYAEHTGAGQIHDITVKVNGLVCDFCARAVEKVFGKMDEVVDINVDLDTHAILIDLKDNADIADETITELITDSGYNVVEIVRE